VLEYWFIVTVTEVDQFLSWKPVSALHLNGELGEVMDLKNTNTNAGILLAIGGALQKGCSVGELPSVEFRVVSSGVDI
jgi:hypothetical protein